MFANARTYLIATMLVALTTPAWALPIPATVKSSWDSLAAGAGSTVYLNGANAGNTNRGGLFGFKDQVNYDSTGHEMLEAVDLVGETPSPTTYVAFCIELTETISSHNPLDYAVVNPEDAPIENVGYGTMGAAGAEEMARLWTGHFGDALSGGTTTRGAFQAAVWELVYDKGGTAHSSGVDLSDGVFTMANSSSNTEYELAAAWLANLDNYAPANLVALTQVDANGEYLSGQDYITEIVPETSALLLWCTIGGVFGVGCWFRRKRQIPA